MLQSVYAKILTTKCSCFQGKESLTPENENYVFFFLFHLTCVLVVCMVFGILFHGLSI